MDLEQPSNQQKESPLYNDAFWLSLYAQHKFHMDLSFPSIKLSGMKFLPCLFETKTGDTTAITPSLSFSNNFNIMLWPHNGISF